MKKIATISIGAGALFKEGDALLGFVPVVGLIIAAQLVFSVCEFAFFLIGTIPMLYKLFAELRFLLIPPWTVLNESLLRTLA